MISIKNGSSANWDMFGKVSTTLSELFFRLLSLLKKRGYDKFTITSIIRPKKADSGIHEAGRAIDFTVSNITGEDIEWFVNHVNRVFPYDVSRQNIKTLIYHETGNYDDPGLHFHLQVKE